MVFQIEFIDEIEDPPVINLFEAEQPRRTDNFKLDLWPLVSYQPRGAQKHLEVFHRRNPPYDADAQRLLCIAIDFGGPRAEMKISAEGHNRRLRWVEAFRQQLAPPD